ncbi:MAG: PA14 domain-containing protein, partial [Planctomycetota bacterium]
MCKKLDSLVCLILVLGLFGNATAQEQKGEILVEWWLNSSGNAVADIRSHPGFPDDPDGSAKLDTFEVPRSKPAEISVLNDNYGARVIGFLYPPADGVYTFWITGDNGSEFLLSTDDDPANATAICQVPGTEWTGDREWDKFPTDQKSAPVTLIGGKKYYVEAIYQEGGGGDGVAIGWGGPTIGAGPVIIDGQYLSPMIRPSDFLAGDPVPADAAVIGDTWINMEWSAGYKAASHDVYFGDNFDDVYAGTGETFQGNQATTFFVVGFPGFPYPEGLVVGTTYYWRVDEKEANGTTHKGNVWSFLVPPVKAYNPGPSDDARFVQTDVALSWEAGFGAKLHTVYFGDNFDDVSNAGAGAPVGTTTFDPGPLEFNKTYYWRVDELDPPFTHTGNVWAFTTTLPGLGTAVMDRWENMGDTDINVLKDSPKYPNDPDVTETVTSFLWDGADLSDYGARIEAWVYAPATGDYTFWLACDDQGELWLSTDDDPSNAEMIAYVKDPPPATGGWTDLNQWTKYDSQKSEPVSLVAGEKYYIMAIWKEGSGGDHCHVAWEGPGIPTRTTIPGSNLSPFEPLNAIGAKPANRATGVTQTPTLRWKAGLQAESHEVYFGTDEAVVANATKASPEYKGDKALGDESFEPGKLPWESTFFWRIDEVAAGNPDSPWIGAVWSFTTADFLIVDDFEEYTDNDAAGEAIWQHWIDGFGVNTNGSQVGYVLP